MSLSRINGFFNWSVRVGQLFGIPIHLHVTLVFFLWPAFSTWRSDFLHGVELGLALVLSILLHELGHALTAKRYGLKGLSIALHGFGGFATSSGYRSPKQALTIVLAGPTVTFALGLILLAAGYLMEPLADSSYEALIQIFIIKTVGSLNILLGFLNLVPSLPFDGGQAVQAILSRSRSHFQAMRDVAHLGMVVTPILFVYGALTQQSFIAIFGLIGLITSVATLMQTGGIRFNEFFAQRRGRKEEAARVGREREKHEAYKGEVYAREKQRAEKERLRKLLNVVDGDDLAAPPSDL